MENSNVSVKPENYLVWAVLTTVMCCLPLGIVAILKSNNVNTFWAAGQIKEAEAASAEAKKWVMIAAGCGLAWIVVCAILGFIGGFIGAMSY